MRILFVHNRYLIRGGEGVSAEAEMRLLRAMGHDVDSHEESNVRVAELSQVRARPARSGRPKPMAC